MPRNNAKPPDETHPQLSISSDKVCYIIVKAREFDAKDVETEIDPASNASDDRMVEVLEDHENDPVREELVAAIAALNVEEQIDLIALSWLGRGDGGLDDWDDLKQQAAIAHNRHTARYLLGNPLLPDHLEEGLSLFSISCDEFESGHL
jgi:hypothetical protein